ncbi:tetratricopeptide repeat protein [Gelidibacter japonicus]|uniref:tetratricopeptide repeat protein n=1 Tax=Gelidibacter japonicus TaxID=1962232 RepID=UPI0013D0E1A4|nr:tetratricopeptide repeat protein [Gelidibacter japonicus]
MGHQDIFLRNNTGNKSKSSIINGFVVRTSEFSAIKKLLGKSKTSKDFPNTVIVGQRGAGKTTLMHRLNYAILDDLNLSNRFLPILFSEEQYNLSDLTNLWEAIAVGIDDNFYHENLPKEIEKIIDNEEDYEIAAYHYLMDFLVNKKKTAVLFMENINFFLKKLSDSENKRLKSILTSDAPFKIIGSSAYFNDGNIDFGDNFYDFFKIVQLDGLSQSECNKLLISIGQEYGEQEEIKSVIRNHPGRVDALRRLTGGVPRTISYLFQIFLDNENGKAIKDLYLLIDTLTLLYKSELDQLSSQQQKVIDAIARKWDAISVREISKKTRLESKNVSSILSYLERNQIVEKVPTNTKNHLYRIKDRFMNIWYLMRFGRKNDHDNVVWLVRFFDAWCDESELTKRIKKHIINLKEGQYDELAAIDMGNTFLSCENVPDSLKEEIITATNSILPDKLLKNVKTNNKEVLLDIRNLLKAKKFEEAENRLNDVEKRNVNYFTLSTSIYLMQGKHQEALQDAKLAWELDNQNSFAAITLGLINEVYLKNYEEAMQFYQKGLRLPKPHPYAAYRLGDIFMKRKDYENAIKYHTQAATKNIHKSLKSLGEIYIQLKQYEKAEKVLKEAVNAKVKGSNTALAKVYIGLKRVKDIEITLKKAVEADEDRSNVNLGKFYSTFKKKKFHEAIKQYEIAIEKGVLDAYNELGKLYIKNKDFDKATEYFMKGLERGNADSAHLLGHHYSKLKNFEKSDEMFGRAIELGETKIVDCWVESIYESRRKNKKLFAKNLLEKYIDAYGNDLRYKLLYAKILLWNGSTSQSLDDIHNLTQEIYRSYNDLENERYFQRALADLVDYFLLLIAKKEYHAALNIINREEHDEFKAMLKPVYFLLMENLQDEFPSEYLKAGKELTETINDLKKEVKDLRKNQI